MLQQDKRGPSSWCCPPAPPAAGPVVRAGGPIESSADRATRYLLLLLRLGRVLVATAASPSRRRHGRGGSRLLCTVAPPPRQLLPPAPFAAVTPNEAAPGRRSRLRGRSYAALAPLRSRALSSPTARGCSGVLSLALPWEKIRVSKRVPPHCACGAGLRGSRLAAPHPHSRCHLRIPAWRAETRASLRLATRNFFRAQRLVTSERAGKAAGEREHRGMGAGSARLDHRLLPLCRLVQQVSRVDLRRRKNQDPKEG